jgi:hypothetical protein
MRSAAVFQSSGSQEKMDEHRRQLMVKCLENEGITLKRSLEQRRMRAIARAHGCGLPTNLRTGNGSAGQTTPADFASAESAHSSDISQQTIVPRADERPSKSPVQLPAPLCFLEAMRAKAGAGTRTEWESQRATACASVNSGAVPS